MKKYGGKAIFDEEMQIRKIEYLGEEYVPGDEEWESVKFIFRSTVLFKLTANDHLGWSHMVIANYLAQATISQLEGMDYYIKEY